MSANKEKSKEIDKVLWKEAVMTHIRVCGAGVGVCQGDCVCGIDSYDGSTDIGPRNA